MKTPHFSETKALRFALAPLLVYILALATLEFGGLGFKGIVETLHPQTNTFTELSPTLLIMNHARVTWLCAVLIFASLAIAVMSASVLIMRSALSSQGFISFLLAGTGLSVIGLAQLWASTTPDSNLGLIFRITQAGLRNSANFTDTDLASITTLVTLVNVLAAIAPIFVMLAGCSLLTIPTNSETTDPRRFLRRRMTQLKALTDLGSALLVAGALHMLVWLRWPIAFTEDAAMQKAFGEWALSVTLYCGTTYSLMIAAFYIPCSWALSKNAETSLQRALPDWSESELADWLDKYGFSSAPIRQLPQIIAALAPMLAGPIGSAISSLGNKAG
ncbi:MULTISPECIES: Ish1 domain-containing protein [Methylomonas]|uniref:Uncharacterized protein n=2 Tax=Methylomonas TaxID=416 RepID=A0A126T3S1_9GAMM|nr:MULTISPECIES: Ish1 domain-containing protein [Methylomonas]AMK76394.1 hypothetical protein JT25_007795 [Methylomonas denitrificans]OAH98654.1 hypothetical protein A1342_12535 [Methylomonas methanica]TCV88423.1 hypothetical protein EDE11_101213 [Methylomonas methanica]